MVASLHDIPGTHRAFVGVGAYTGSTDNGYSDVLMRAPFDCVLTAINAYFQGTSSLVGGTATDYFTLVTYDGASAIGTAGPAGTIAYRTPLAVYSGSQALSEGDVVSVQYGTVGGTAALNMPRATFELQFKSG